MPNLTNVFNQPIGKVVNWRPAKLLQAMALHGSYCDVVSLNPVLHAQALYEANSVDDGRMWTYLPYGPFDSLQSYKTWLNDYCLGADPLFYTIINKQTQQAIGLASYLRIDPANGVIEVGHLAYSPALQRSIMATEAMFLMMQYVFELGYRRYEWKCNALNAPSCRAATRLGFSFEGTFRQAAVTKGHNRDTAWYSIIDSEWPALRKRYQLWLSPENFDAQGNQRLSLSALA
jgi:RimJ/RimL family protein N-acetyltransferase